MDERRPKQPRQAAAAESGGPLCWADHVEALGRAAEGSGLMTAGLAAASEHRFGCRGLAQALLENTEPLREGWVFVRPIRGEKGQPAPYDQAPRDGPTWEYLAVEVGNDWNDLALYRRRVVGAPRGE